MLRKGHLAINMSNALKIAALFSYSFIFLSGDIIGIPFIIWLVFTSVDVGNIDQLFAILGIIGMVLNFTKYTSVRSIQILSFVLMCSPVISRLIQVPIEKFNYLAFQIPVAIFTLSYLTLIIKTNNKTEELINSKKKDEK